MIDSRARAGKIQDVPGASDSAHSEWHPSQPERILNAKAGIKQGILSLDYNPLGKQKSAISSYGSSLIKYN